MKHRSRDSRRKPGSHPEEETAQRAAKEDVAALMRQLAYPSNRAEVDDFPGVARALAREARRYALPIPTWLAAIAGYPKPPPVLRVVVGGRHDDAIGNAYQNARVR